MVSIWQNPFPVDEYKMNRVVVYFYSGRWIPIMFHTLDEAIALHRKAVQLGKQLFIFPADCNPSNESASDITFPNLNMNSTYGVKNK